MSVEDNVIEILTSKKNRSWFTGKLLYHNLTCNFSCTILSFSNLYTVLRILADVTKNCTSPQDFDKRCLVKLDDIYELINKTMDIVQQQPMLLELDPPVTICG
jgi:hypothetical protein